MSLVRKFVCFSFALVLCSFGVAVASTESEIDQGTKDKLVAAVRAKLGEMTDSKNADGKRDKRAEYSQFFRALDDGNYVGSVHVNTAGNESLTTERFNVTLSPKGDGFEVTNTEVVDTFTGLFRNRGLNCYPFEKFNFDREGLKMTATNGGMCEQYYQGEVSAFLIMADDLKYNYTIPEHVGILQQSHDFYSLKDILWGDHAAVFKFDAARFRITCDAETCEELINESFTGMDRVSKEERANAPDVPSGGVYAPLIDRVEKQSREILDARKENPFSGFRPPAIPGNRRYNATVIKDDNQGIGISYNNWGGYEVTFYAYHRLKTTTKASASATTTGAATRSPSTPTTG